ncbi:MAG: histidine kinase, partial [Rudanella sp.]|nr:histidine kinase [Rudanella sp.]
AKDSLYSQDKMKQLLSLTFDEKQQAQEIEAAKAEYRSTVHTYIFIGLLAVLGAIALMLYRNNRQQQRANALLQRQRDEIHEQRTKAENALTELRATQTQLIQKEKMASLGELTAGIAHEIQNPLNFVNNFSEVSAELVGELKDELDRGDTAEAKAIADDLTQNLQKITHHGGRASAIVKGMLEHSRSSTGERQATDLNALADEYLRLAYHGLRAKDKTFNANLKTDFDPTLPKIELVSQDMGRVLLNLFNNAFYAVQQRQKQEPANYQPTVTVQTCYAQNQSDHRTVEIRVSDNGTGMPESVKAKIFQPFFTTKPTGEGTGLGLSLSYDIVTKGHGGMLTVESVEGEGTTFIVNFPA